MYVLVDCVFEKDQKLPIKMEMLILGRVRTSNFSLPNFARQRKNMPAFIEACDKVSLTNIYDNVERTQLNLLV